MLEIAKRKKVFENSSVAFLPGLKRKFFYNHVASQNVLLFFQPRKKKSFWKFVKYFWRYSISAGTFLCKVVTLPLEKLKFLHFQDVGKVVPTLLCWKTLLKMSVHLKFSTTIASFLFFQRKKSFWKFVKYFWRYSISARTV